MKLRLYRTLLLIALGTVLVTWPGILAALSSGCLANSDWCPDGGTAPQGSAPRPSRSAEPGDPPPCPPP